MRDSLFFRTLARVLFPILVFLSLYLYWRGHNNPGGGFAGGLIAVLAFVIIAVADSVKSARRLYVLNPLVVIVLGLVIAIFSGFLAPMFGEGVFFQGYWGKLGLPFLGDLPLGSPMLFDLGVFFVVLGIGAKIIFTLLEDA